MYLEFKDEMLIPQINGEIYFKIYELENWLRRICLTAYMKEYGADWISHIPFQIVNRVRSRSKQNENFFYFDLDSDENLIWAVTQGELMTILLDDAIAHQVKDLTGFSKSALSQKLEELKGIRNMLAHNRALTSTASTIFTGITVSLFQGIKIFKERILYPPLGHIRVESEIIEYFNMGMDDNDWSKFQAFISLDNGIYSIACLPASGSSGTYPSAYKLLLFYNVNSGCKILTSARIKLPSAGRAFPTGKK